MNRDEALKWVLDKSQTIAEAKEGWAWVQQFIDEDAAKIERNREQIKLREKQILKDLGNDKDPDFQIDPNLRPKNWDTQWVAVDGRWIALPSKEKPVEPKKNNTPWKEKDVSEVLELRRSGFSDVDIAVLMDRKPNAIRDLCYKIRTGRQVGKRKDLGNNNG
jgi:hypothetical protein